MKKTVIALLALLASGTSLAATPWQKITQPVSGSPQSIGAFANGCIVGAQALPLNATGYQVMRTDQNRYFGHPDLVQFIQRLSNQAHNKGMGTVLIGDMGMPAGDALTAATPAISPDWTSIFFFSCRRRAGVQLSC
jgi:penicillin-insensitive murein endopeptidase